MNGITISNLIVQCLKYRNERTRSCQRTLDGNIGRLEKKCGPGPGGRRMKRSGILNRSGSKRRPQTRRRTIPWRRSSPTAGKLHRPLFGFLNFSIQGFFVLSCTRFWVKRLKRNAVSHRLHCIKQHIANKWAVSKMHSSDSNDQINRVDSLFRPPWAAALGC